MQNLDFYSGNNTDSNPGLYENPDPEYFSRGTDLKKKESIKSQKRANRLFSLIIGLCIISFTAGLVIGIKFANGKNREIVDAHTMKTMSAIGNKVSDLFKGSISDSKNNNVSVNEKYPKEEYPFVIRIGKDFTPAVSKNLIKFLRSKGHTVIVAKNNNRYKIYTKPFKTEHNANLSLQKITMYKNNTYYSNASILRR